MWPNPGGKAVPHKAPCYVTQHQQGYHPAAFSELTQQATPKTQTNVELHRSLKQNENIYHLMSVPHRSYITANIQHNKINSLFLI